MELKEWVSEASTKPLKLKEDVEEEPLFIALKSIEGISKIRRTGSWTKNCKAYWFFINGEQFYTSRYKDDISVRDLWVGKNLDDLKFSYEDSLKYAINNKLSVIISNLRNKNIKKYASKTLPNKPLKLKKWLENN